MGEAHVHQRFSNFNGHLEGVKHRHTQFAFQVVAIAGHGGASHDNHFGAVLFHHFARQRHAGRLGTFRVGVQFGDGQAKRPDRSHAL